MTSHKKVSIFTVAYDQDLEFLKLNLRSINKFCNGFHEHVIVIDDHNQDCIKTQEYLESINQKYYIDREAKRVKKGYIRQQYMKLMSDQYVSPDTDYICHVDCDNLYFEPHHVDIYFKDNLPIMGKQSWVDMSNRIFKPWTDKTLEFESDFNFMRRMPLVYPTSLTREVCSYIVSLKGDLIDYLNTLKTISEYNLLGAYAYRYKRDEFYWIDVKAQQSLWYKHSIPCRQFSSRKKNRRYIDLNQPNKIVEIIKKY